MIGWIVAAYIAYALWLEQPSEGRTGFFLGSLIYPVTKRFKK